jgi:hypothetical protein
MLGEVGCDGVQMDVAADLHEMGIGVDRNGCVSAPEQGTVSVVAKIEHARELASKIPHAVGEVASPAQQQQVIMVAEKAVAVNFKAGSLDCLS